MRKTDVITTLTIVLFSLCCSKSTPFSIDVSQITPTDNNGNITGAADNSDWGFDAEWSETEKAFFRTDPVDLSDSKQADIRINPVYPNPCSNRVITLQFTSSDTTYIRIAIVNEKLQRLALYTFRTNAGINAYNIPFPEASFPANKNYRLYYSFDTFAQPGYYKGHGDVALR